MWALLSPGPALGHEGQPFPSLQLRGQQEGGRWIGLGAPWLRCTSLMSQLVRRFIEKPPLNSCPCGNLNDWFGVFSPCLM